MEDFYKEQYNKLYILLDYIKEELSSLIYVEHISARIKSKDSVILKLNKKNISPSLTNALTNLNDIIGIRTVVRFPDEVYKIREYIYKYFEVINEKDYIINPKKNGYRSLHLIIKGKLNNFENNVEIQIRTISQDAWACLEHKMKYKKDIEHQEIIIHELKRCADEMASIDLSMQSISDMINNGIEC